MLLNNHNLSGSESGVKVYAGDGYITVMLFDDDDDKYGDNDDDASGQSVHDHANDN